MVSQSRFQTEYMDNFRLIMLLPLSNLNTLYLHHCINGVSKVL